MNGFVWMGINFIEVTLFEAISAWLSLFVKMAFQKCIQGLMKIIDTGKQVVEEDMKSRTGRREEMTCRDGESSTWIRW